MATGAHAGQTVEAGAPQEVQEHRLGLVVGRVAGEDIGWENGEASLPGTRLQIGAVFDGRPFGPEGGAELFCGGRHHAGLGRCFGSKAVIDVHRRGPAPGRARQCEQGEGVSAPRHGARHIRPRRGERAPRQETVGRAHRSARSPEARARSARRASG